jgi:hypothetical protein
MGDSPGKLSQDHGPRWLRNLLRLVALGMGAMHTATAVLQQSMNEDGINYLDLGDALLRGDLGAAVTGTWSPAYGVFVAGAVRVIEPSVWWEFPTVQVANYLLYVLALFSFEYFWRGLTARYHGNSRDGEALRFPPAAWLVLGYSLFIWTALNLVHVWTVTPDMAVSAVVYLAAGLLIRTAGTPARLRPALGLGLVLGFGYLVKAALLPLGLVAIGLAAVSLSGPPAQRIRAVAAALGTMLLVAGPWIAALSVSTGKPTIGEVGRFTYLKHVNEMPYPDFHGALDRLAGAPRNPPRRVFDEPRIYEFAEPVAGTYPMAFDPAYWTAGLEPTVTLRGQVRALLTSAMAYFDLFVRVQGGFLALVLLVWLLRRRERASGWRLEPEAALVLWALAAFGLYALVHVLPRYIAPFVLLFWAGILAGIRFPSAPPYARFASVSMMVLAGAVWVNLVAFNLDGVRRVTGFEPLSESASQPGQEEVAHHSANHPEIAAALADLGLGRGDKVGFIGYSYTEYWARLARLSIVAEIQPQEAGDFWSAPPGRQAAVLAAFAGTGAAAVVAEPVSLEALPAGWQAVGETGYLVHLLR